MRIKTFLLFLSAGAALAANVAQASLITNGNFELTTNGNNKQLSAVAVGTDSKYTTLTGWNSSNGNDGGYNFVLNSGIITTSDSAIALRSYASTVNHGNVFASDSVYYPGKLTQTVSGLTVGSAYVLTFDYALGQQAGFTGANNNNFWEVGFGATTLDSSRVSITDGGFSGWKTATMTFTATSASQILSFLAKTDSPGAPPFMLLDGVSMQAAVPEPSTLSLMLGGVGLLGWLARRRRRA